MEQSFIDNQRIIIIYYDENNQSEDLRIQLEENYGDIIYLTTLESTLNCIQSIKKKKKKYFFITLYSNISQIQSYIEIFQDVYGVFIYRSRKTEENKYVFHENLKIIGIYSSIHLLFKSIEEEINLINKNYYKWAFFNQENYLVNDLSKQSNDFILSIYFTFSKK